MKTKNLIISIVISLLSPISVYADNQNDDSSKRFILNLSGSGDMYEDKVPDIDGDGLEDSAMCFDVQVIDAKTNKAVGRGTDCLSKVTPTGTGVGLVGTTYFHLPGGTLITRGMTSVQPVLKPTVSPRSVVITHITGASSDQNSVIGGTGRFAGASGKVRLSGMVNMANFTGEVGTPIIFDCLFVIDLAKNNH